MKTENKTRLVVISGDSASLYEGTNRLITFDGAKEADVDLITKVLALTPEQIKEYKENP
jgi:5'-3' exonuclease